MIGNVTTGMGNVLTAGQPFSGGGHDPNFDTLAELYEFGLTDNPTVDNMFVGAAPLDFYYTYLREDGGVTIGGQTDSAATNIVPFAVWRRRGEYFSEVAHWDSRFTTSSITDGAVRHLWSLTTDDGVTTRYIGSTTMAAKPNENTGYSPGGFGADDRSKWIVNMLNRQGAGETTQWEVNSDGGMFIECLLPGDGDAEAAQVFYFRQSAMSPITGSNVKAGNALADTIVGPAGSYSDNYEMGSIRFYNDEMNVGVAQARGHYEFWIRGAMGGTPQRSLQLFAPADSTLSSTDAAALKYNTTTDKLELSVNGGAYSPLLTAAADTGITQLTGDVTAGPGSGSVAATLAAGSAAVLNSGTLNAARLPAFSGDVSTSVGTATTAIGANKVTLAMLATIAEARVIGGAVGAGTATPTALTGAQVSAILSAANDTITTAGSNVTDLDTSSLDGDNDGDYECQDSLIATGGAADYTLQPNAVSTNQKCIGIYSNAAGDPNAVAAEVRTDLFIGAGDAAASVVMANYKLMSKSGRVRGFWNSIWQNSGGTGDLHETVSGEWSGSGNITSLRRHSSVASRIATGSYGRVRRCRNLV